MLLGSVLFCPRGIREQRLGPTNEATAVRVTWLSAPLAAPCTVG